MSEDEWTQNIKKIKEREKEIDAIGEAKRKEWEELKEKHKDEATKIIDLLNSELKKVLTVYEDSSLKKYDKPKVEGDNRYVKLDIPIVRGGSYYSFGISFWLKLTEKGYGLDVVKSTFLTRDSTPHEDKTYIPPLVTAIAIRKEVTEVLQARTESIRIMTEQEDRYRRQ